MQRQSLQNQKLTVIPPRTLLETRPPALFASRLALREGNAKKPVYQIHKWWARRLGSVFRSILIAATRSSRARTRMQKAFYEKQDFSRMVVMDPFVGGGTSVVEAAKCNANVIGVDIDPVACFVTRAELNACDEMDLQASFDSVAESVQARISELYKATLDDGSVCDVVYAFWVEMVVCTKCNRSYHAHPHYQLSRYRKLKRQVVFCSSCGQVCELGLHRRNFSCSECGASTEILCGTAAKGKGVCPDCRYEQPLMPVDDRPPSHILFALLVLDSGGRLIFKRASDRDRALYARAHELWRHRELIDEFVPKEDIPRDGRSDNRPLCFGYKKYRDLFNSRQLLCLSFLAEAISNVNNKAARELLGTAFSDCLACNNMFCYYAFDYQKLTPLFGLHAYHRAYRPVENNVWGVRLGRGSFEKCYRKLLRGKTFAKFPFEYRYKQSRPVKVETGESLKIKLVERIPHQGTQSFGLLINDSSERLFQIPNSSVDLILSDPPYYDNLAYSELSDFYHVWIRRLKLESYCGNERRSTPIKESLYVKDVHSPEQRQTFQRGLRNVLTECHRVLRDQGMMVFTFHHRSAAAWNALGDSLIEAKFKVTNVFPVRSEGSSQFHSSVGNIKWDAVFCCRKLGNGGYLTITHTDKLIQRAVGSWRSRLQSGNFVFEKADQQSLRKAIATMYRCNAGILSGDHLQ